MVGGISEESDILLFDSQDISLLRLIGLCRDYPADIGFAGIEMLSQEFIKLLAHNGLLCIT